MRSVASIVVVAGLSCVVWATALPNGAEASRVRPIAASATTTASPVPETDAQRRQRLNARLAEMIRSGEGSRLSEATSRPRAPVARPGARATSPKRPPRAVEAAPVPAVPIAALPVTSTAPVSDRTEMSTIAPPAYRGGPARPTGRGYTPPRLDLTTPVFVPGDDVECLTQAIYYEARNESEEGQAAVAEVVINRSRAGNYPGKICDVVYQRNSRTCQFTFTCDGSIGRSPINMRSWGRAERIARDVYEGRSKSLLPRTSVNYHANYVRPSWGRRLERVRQIGAHIFYGAALNGHSTPGSHADAVPTRPSGRLQFVRNEALDRAYARLASDPAAQAAPATP